jgi:hypothetical protein
MWSSTGWSLQGGSYRVVLYRVVPTGWSTTGWFLLGGPYRVVLCNTEPDGVVLFHLVGIIRSSTTKECPPCNYISPREMMQ